LIYIYTCFYICSNCHMQLDWSILYCENCTVLII
jgi:hypothetical protein